MELEKLQVHEVYFFTWFLISHLLSTIGNSSFRIKDGNHSMSLCLCMSSIFSKEIASLFYGMTLYLHCYWCCTNYIYGISVKKIRRTLSTSVLDRSNKSPMLSRKNSTISLDSIPASNALEKQQENPKPQTPLTSDQPGSCIHVQSNLG